MLIPRRAIAPIVSSLIAVVALLGVISGSARAAQGDGPDNVVAIHIVNGEIKLTNRGLGMCKNHQDDCPNEIVWKWIGGDPSPDETEKIVISYVKGTPDAYNCFQDDAANPRLFFEILERQSEVTATVSPNCPAKSAWLYQVSCVRTDPGFEGRQCTGIAPVDPGAVIG